MGGWVLFAAIALLAAVILWRMRFPRTLGMFVLAAIVLGAAGYAWQGSPARAGQPVAAQAASFAIDDEQLALRNAMFGRYGTTAGYLTPADAMMRMGAPDSAARMLQGGINKDPRSTVLWTELATVIAVRDGTVSPAALFAFRCAISFNPADPAPWFFLGMAQVRAGEFAKGKATWSRALALTPANVGYRGEIATRLALLDYFLANMPPPAAR